MKEYRNYEHRAGLRGRAKRIFAAVIAFVLVLAFSSVALADSGKNGGTPGERPGQSGKTTDDPKPGNRTGNRNAEMTGLNVDKIEEAIAALTDESAKASLTELLSAYVAAFDARQAAVEAKDTDSLSALAQAVAASKAALDTALEAAGISTDTIYGVPEEAMDGTGRINSNRPALDTAGIAADIAALTDEDAKANLTALLAAYETALAAEQGADGSLTQNEMKALRDATQAAERALLEATKEAGVTGGVGRGQLVNGYAYGNTEMNMVEIAAQIAGLSDTNEFKTMLQDRLQAYEDALLAEQTADASTLTPEELAALSDATKAAADALKAAMEEAGIPVRTQANDRNEYAIDVLDGQGGEAPDATGGIFRSFLDWLNGLFQ